MDVESAKQEVDRVFDSIDTDCSNSIDYSEFIIASINKKRFLSNKRLKQAFNLIDKNNDEKISLSEIKKIF